MEQSQFAERSRLIDEVMDNWENKIKEIQSGRPTFEAFLELAITDLTHASQYIDCPYCQRHMNLEGLEIERVLSRIQSEGNMSHKHGPLERARAFLRSCRIVLYVIFGGLRRAGLI